MSRIRRSLQELQQKYDDRIDRSSLEKLVRAFVGIQDLTPDNPKSFEFISGYHGLPFVSPPEGTPAKEWWGGYCWHETVLFPTWHRAYVLELENALRSVPGCEDVTLPFWDETLESGILPSPKPIPSILTTPTFTFDANPGVHIPNPLFSYKLKQELDGTADEIRPNRSSKPVSYQIVRYPLSGLVGTPEDRRKTSEHNSVYTDQDTNTDILNENVAQWLLGTVKIPKDPDHPKVPMPDTYSVRARFHTCLDAPNYTVFSNTASQAQWIKDARERDSSSHNSTVFSLESPHNAIHLALGGFYERGKYHASPIAGANGDMGDNNVAGFDPIFFFHHCYIDYVFSVWQKRKNLTTRGSLTVINSTPAYPGTILKQGQPPRHKKNDRLNMTTLLEPFKKSNGQYYTSDDVTDLRDVDVAYGLGSLDRFKDHLVPVPNSDSITGLSSNPFVATQKVQGINRAKHDGSFVVRVYATKPGTIDKIAIAREAFLSRFNVEDCSNCRNHLEPEWYFSLDKRSQEYLVGFSGREDGKIAWDVEIHTADGIKTRPETAIPGGAEDDWPKVEDF
ncbi:putative tyrosinase [Amanita rubescens]|nr:putative tyrosinase [Amanita rubescens]